MIAPAGSNRYVGWVESSRGLHSYSVSRRADGLVDGPSLAADDELLALLLPLKDKSWVMERLCGDAAAFARALQKLVADVDASEQQQQEKGSAAPCSGNNSRWSKMQVLVNQLEQVGWDKVLSVSPDLSVLRLRTHDSSGRAHAFDVSVPAAYPIAAPLVQVALPVPVSVPWPLSRAGGSLSLVLEAVEREVGRFEPLFAALEDLDMHCWVLEPLQPTFATTSRRIAIERGCSVVIELRPEDPTGVCEMRFLGPPQRVLPLQAHLGQHLYRWNPSRSVRSNLEAVLGVTLPLRSQQQQSGQGHAAGEETFLAECGICYSYALRGAVEGGEVGGKSSSTIPDQPCPNPRCGRMYHNPCLAEWLQAVPSSRTSFGTTFGSCPYCGEMLSTKSSFST